MFIISVNLNFFLLWGKSPDMSKTPLMSHGVVSDTDTTSTRVFSCPRIRTRKNMCQTHVDIVSQYLGFSKFQRLRTSGIAMFKNGFYHV